MLGKKVSLELFFFACLVSVLWSLICGFLKIFNENSKVVEKSRRWWKKRLKTVCVQNHYIVQKIRNKKWKAKLASFSSWSYQHNMLVQQTKFATHTEIDVQKSENDGYSNAAKRLSFFSKMLRSITCWL